MGGNRETEELVVLALTSRWPARPVLLTTWQRSGGPSSRNVAGSVRLDEMDVRRGRGAARGLGKKGCGERFGKCAHQGPRFVPRGTPPTRPGTIFFKGMGLDESVVYY
jgi:hypothetical protein